MKTITRLRNVAKECNITVKLEKASFNGDKKRCIYFIDNESEKASSDLFSPKNEKDVATLAAFKKLRDKTIKTIIDEVQAENPDILGLKSFFQ